MDEKFKNFEVIDEATITNLNGETNEKYKGYVSTLLRWGCSSWSHVLTSGKKKRIWRVHHRLPWPTVIFLHSLNRFILESAFEETGMVTGRIARN